MIEDYVAKHQAFIADVLKKVKDGTLSVDNACISINSLLYSAIKDAEDATHKDITEQVGFELFGIAQKWLAKTDPNIVHEWRTFFMERHKSAGEGEK